MTMRMTDGERFLATMHYRPRDRCPMCDFGFWPETIELWHAQGLPAWVQGGHDTTYTNQFFGMDVCTGGPGLNVGLCPAFETKVLEDRGDHELVQQADGVIVLRKKFMSSIPEHHGHLLVDRESWNKHYKWRLNPDTPERYPNWDEARQIWNTPQPYAYFIWAGSLYGCLRDWMGVENISYLVYDDPALFEEMVTTLADLIVEVHRRAFAQGAKAQVAGMWEDMCYNAGPLLSPPLFKKYLVPQYQRITEQLRRHGCDVIWVDCDGKIDELIPLWLEAGVNCMFPIEIGTWGADPIKYRKQYGKELLMQGGFDKHILAKGPHEIEAEIYRLAPLVEEGGYIPFPDHRVPPDVSLANYMFYLETARRVWGKGVNLKPLGQLEPSSSR
ncbi:MAG: uroporphyrinogen decarboxylase family protein [Verrucomicrobiae bacterium]|nr:uroporphyrinogen decarboxylase family protein [Verrucomicrobiae bacterium]